MEYIIVTGSAKTRQSAHITQVQKLVLFLVTVYDTQVLLTLSAS